MPEVAAVVWHGPGDVRVESRRLPRTPAAGWVRLRVDWCGVCGSDVLEFVRGPVVIPADVSSLVLGHEVAGRVVAVGEGVTELRVTDPVVSDSLVGCGGCIACERDQPNRCPRLVAVGQQIDGGLAEFVDVPAATCLRVPSGLRLDVAALAEPLAVAVRAIATAGALDGRRALILGAGPVGVLVALLLRAHRGSTLIVDPSVLRRERAAALAGMLSAEKVPVPDHRKDGPWVVFECSGNGDALNAVLRTAPAASTIVVVGIHGPATPVDLSMLVQREISVQGSLSHDRRDFARALAELATAPDRFEPVIALRTDLAGGLAALADLAGAVVLPGKVLVRPADSPRRDRMAS